MKKLLTALLLGLFVLASPGRAQDDFKPERGFINLFNGKDLAGWYQKGKDKEDLAGKTQTPNQKFKVEDGIIKVAGGGGDLYTMQTFDQEFHLKLEFRAAPKADSGLFIRGPQLQVRDYPTVGPYRNLKNFKAGDWNELDVVVTGTNALCKCNDEIIEKAFRIGPKGAIGLQTETGKFEFRRIRIKVASADKPGIGASPANRAVRSAQIKGVVNAQPRDTPKKRLLLITESKGFPHPVSARQYTIVAKDATVDRFPKMEGLNVQLKKDKKVGITFNGRLDKPLEIKDKDEVLAIAKPCLVETTFMELAKKTGWFEVDCTQNSRGEINAENLKKYDAVFFYTTGELPLSDVQKSDLLAFVRSGKGFGGSHCATDTFYKWKEYGELIGAYFISHPWTQKVRVIVEDNKHAATKHLGDSFFIDDEIYQYRAPYSRDKGHVLLKLDMDSVKGLGKRKDDDNALAWVHSYGKGRVFYTALGHRPEVWNDPRFQQHVVGGLRDMFGLDK
jgi:type 1 glutamine amidotransferase